MADYATVLVFYGTVGLVFFGLIAAGGAWLDRRDRRQARELKRDMLRGAR